MHSQKITVWWSYWLIFIENAVGNIASINDDCHKVARGAYSTFLFDVALWRYYPHYENLIVYIIIKPMFGKR